MTNHREGRTRAIINSGTTTTTKITTSKITTKITTTTTTTTTTTIIATITIITREAGGIGRREGGKRTEGCGMRQ